MKIALLHYTCWPEIGGVEQVLRDQANMLSMAGHEVTVLAGKGADPREGYEVRILPELAPDYALYRQVHSVLEQGQADQNFNRYRTLLVDLLREALKSFDLTLVHNIFTMHHNLTLTRALQDLASEFRLVAWTHDLVAGNADYALPNPTQPPWNLMQLGNPHVAYVAVSDWRAAEVEEQLKPQITPQVIPNLVDRSRLFGLSADVREAYPSLDLASRDFVFLLPTQVIPRKNIEFALEVVKQLREMERDPLLIITAPPSSGNPSNQHYGNFLRQTLPEELLEHVVFMGDFFPVNDAALRDLYLLADCLLFPPLREGCGLPVLEAAVFRLPIWCQDNPAYRELAEEEAAYPLTDLSRLADAVIWLESQPSFRQQRRCRALFDPAVVYHTYYDPLFAALA